jgi:hypothetical protein
MSQANRSARLKNILAAGGLTTLILLTLVALALRDNRQVAAAAPESGAALSSGGEVAPAALSAGAPASVEQLQVENATLRQAVDTLLAREAQYQARLQEANQVLSQPAPAWSGEGEDEDEWWDNDEHDDHGGEREEHEEGEHDDD